MDGRRVALPRRSNLDALARHIHTIGSPVSNGMRPERIELSTFGLKG
jgi:hypothetical protein